MPRTFNLLADLVNLQQGVAFRHALTQEPAGPVRVIDMGHAQGDVIDTSTLLPAIAFERDTHKFELQPLDLIFRSRGISNQAVLVQAVHTPTIVAAPLIRLRVRDPQQLDPLYLHWALNSGPMQRAIDTVARGSIVRMVTVGMLGTLALPVPPLPVQRRIAEYARLQKQEVQLTEALLAQRRTQAEQILWANAQEAW